MKKETARLEHWTKNWGQEMVGSISVLISFT